MKNSLIWLLKRLTVLLYAFIVVQIMIYAPRLGEAVIAFLILVGIDSIFKNFIERW